MLFLFRQLRRLELHKRSGRYFLYAFGEIVLIVVGILIAVQINKWQESRQDEILKQQYLRTMAREFEAEIRSITANSDNIRLHAELVSLLLEIAENPELVRRHPVEFMVAVRGSPNLGAAPVNTSTYEELRSTGHFRLLDDELKRALNDFIRYDERVRITKVARNLIDFEYAKLNKGILTIEQDLWLRGKVGRVFPGSIENIRALSYDADSLVEAAHRMAANKAFLYWLPEQRTRLLITTRNHAQRLRRIDRILELVNAQLED